LRDTGGAALGEAINFGSWPVTSPAVTQQFSR
jgi:hypothetical protein